MTSTRSAIIGASLGVTSMFLLDPARGARRRALIRDKAVKAGRKTRDVAEATWRDLNNRITGLQARSRAFMHDRPVDDETLVARARTALGRAASHPRAISVTAADGFVTLTGDALELEVGSIVSAVGYVRGVKGVHNYITAHPSADGVPSLQGDSDRPGEWTTWLRSEWSPTAMVLASVGVCTALAAVAAKRR